MRELREYSNNYAAKKSYGKSSTFQTQTDRKLVKKVNDEIVQFRKNKVKKMAVEMYNASLKQRQYN